MGVPTIGVDSVRFGMVLCYRTKRRFGSFRNRRLDMPTTTDGSVPGPYDRIAVCFHPSMDVNFKFLYVHLVRSYGWVRFGFAESLASRIGSVLVSYL